MIRTQEQSLKGEVRQYLLNGEGEVDGLLLCDGTQVHFPPHLGTELAAIVQPAAAITVQGQRENANVVMAFAITNQSTGQTVVDGGPPTPPAPPAPFRTPLHHPGAAHSPGRHTPPHLHTAPPMPLHRRKEALMTAMSARGQIAAILNGPAGDANGFVLADKSIVRFKPHEAFAIMQNIGIGTEVEVQGYGFENPYGRCIEATVIYPVNSTYNGSLLTSTL